MIQLSQEQHRALSSLEEKDIQTLDDFLNSISKDDKDEFLQIRYKNLDNALQWLVDYAKKYQRFLPIEFWQDAMYSLYSGYGASPRGHLPNVGFCDALNGPNIHLCLDWMDNFDLYRKGFAIDGMATFDHPPYTVDNIQEAMSEYWLNDYKNKKDDGMNCFEEFQWFIDFTANEQPFLNEIFWGQLLVKLFGKTSEYKRVGKCSPVEFTMSESDCKYVSTIDNHRWPPFEGHFDYKNHYEWYQISKALTYYRARIEQNDIDNYMDVVEGKVGWSLDDKGQIKVNV